ncbi:hypothetical protein ARGLB_036_00290 [Arthrobacter globiformis NBRC 12137]|uniref:Uncharacterized protein n=2 Tax=Arthrobacter globiformis TaxID=1665 RepID=H0QJY2_ARTG1|nr:hypothetical protein ARGLB_036_00290 [Arthrobacter globiformis NBRC 12137]
MHVASDGHRRLSGIRNFTREPLVPPAVREEPTMSTVHRLLLSAFARSARRIAGRRLAGNVSPIAQPSMGSDVLTCTPWAGLYVEGRIAS